MIARAAMALHASVSPTGTWEKLTDSARKHYAKHARAVLMAVRTPGVGVWIDADCDDDVHPIDCFTAMIDAILSETP